MQPAGNDAGCLLIGAAGIFTAFTPIKDYQVYNISIKSRIYLHIKAKLIERIPAARDALPRSFPAKAFNTPACGLPSDTLA